MTLPRLLVLSGLFLVLATPLARAAPPPSGTS